MTVNEAVQRIRDVRTRLMAAARADTDSDGLPLEEQLVLARRCSAIADEQSHAIGDLLAAIDREREGKP